MATAFNKVVLTAIATSSVVFSASQVRALEIGYQFTGTQPFKTLGAAQVNTPLLFPRFDPLLVPPAHKNPVLKGYAFYLPSVTLSGLARIDCDDALAACPLPGPFSASASITFDSMTTGSNVTFPSGIPASIQGPAETFRTNKPITGSASNLVSPDILFTSLEIGNFITPPATPYPSSDFYKTAWTYVPVDGLTVNFDTAVNKAIAEGTIGVRYLYEYVPGPLPLLGAGAAFGWSRRLRKRITHSA